MTPDHQLARSTAEKIRKLNEDIRGGYETTESVEALILASYRERDRAATAQHPLQSIIDGKRTPPAIDRAISDNLMALIEPAATARGGETPRVISVIWRGDRGEYGVSIPDWDGGDVVSLDDYSTLQRALTALQESNREVVGQRDQWAELYKGECMVRAGMTEKCNRAVAEVVTLRARLALADEMAKKQHEQIVAMRTTTTANLERWSQLESLVEMIDEEPTGFFIACEKLPDEGDVWKCFTDFLDERIARRWTAPQAGTTSRPTATEGGV